MAPDFTRCRCRANEPLDPRLEDPCGILYIRSSRSQGFQVTIITRKTVPASPLYISGELAHGPPYPPKRNHQSGDAWVSLHQQVTRGKESGTVAGPTQRAAFSAWGSVSRSPSRLLYVSRRLRPGDARQMRAGPPSLHKRGAMPTSPAPTKNA